MTERMITALGVLRGPATQGIDMALIVTDGEARIVRRESLTFPLAAESPRDKAAGGLADIEQDFIQFCANTVRRFLENAALARDAVALIGFEPAPENEGRSGEDRSGEDLARATGIDVVYDFGAADREAGGKGRPLEPVYHRALAVAAGLARPLAVIEIGEEDQVIYIGEDGSLSVYSLRGGAGSEAIAEVGRSVPARPLHWLLCGEEVRAASLLDVLASALAEPVYRATEMGWPSDHFGAEAYAYLAVRSLRKLPLTFPGTTGVRQPLTGGRIARAPRR